ncbi:MAG: hypothetical protein JO189_01665 [Deltaproteobacteria bacterium]|nr:hypothetical protein [Deltaproteobacteria bacterium]
MASWTVCGYYTKLWNLRYSMGAAHRILRATTALLTFVFTIAYFSVGYMPQVAAVELDRWKDHLQADGSFAANAFETSYLVVKDLHPQQMARMPAPVRNEDGTLRKVTWPDDACEVDAARSFASQSTDNFRSAHPFLAKIAPPITPNEQVYEDSRRFWQENPGGFYPIQRAIEIAGAEIWKSLEPKLPATARRTRIILVGSFLAAQMIPFSLIGYGAYKDLKVSV